MKIQDLEGKIGTVRMVFPLSVKPRVNDLRTGETTDFFVPRRAFISISLEEGIYAEDIPIDVSCGLPTAGDVIFLGEFTNSKGFRWRVA